MPKGTYFTVEKIGPKQSLTPEGFLMCEEVPIARTGMMIYGPDETPIKAGVDGIVKIFRNPEEVFSAITMASANGKSVTNDHPNDDVKPENWQELSHGIMMNVRRGEGAYDDLLFGDLLVTTPEAIEAVQDGKREVSLGYEADYEETGVPGVGKQSNIIINHVALVEQGRCGPRCAISDHKPVIQKGKSMKTHSKILDALMKAFKAKDAEEVEKIAEEVGDEVVESPEGGDTHIHIHNGEVDKPVVDEEPDNLEKTKVGDDDLEAFKVQNDKEHAEMRERLDALEAALAGKSASEDEIPDDQIMDEISEEFKEEAAKAKDSKYLGESFKDTLALAEILAPGIRVPTYDASARPGQTFKKICGLRRQALDLAYNQPSTRGIIDEILSGQDLNTKNMTCDAVRTLFRSAAAVKRSANNSGKGRDASAVSSSKAVGVKTLAELNRVNAERYADK
jgi:hypothetical protein